MTWEQKYAAIQALGGVFNVYLTMREPGNWYVHDGPIEIGGNGGLLSPTVVGSSPEDAVNKHWEELTKLKPGLHLVVHASGGDKRRHVRWNGYMWQDLPVQK